MMMTNYRHRANDEVFTTCPITQLSYIINNLRNIVCDSLSTLKEM